MSWLLGIGLDLLACCEDMRARSRARSRLWPAAYSSSLWPSPHISCESTMASLRCSQCSTYWPNTAVYSRCPECRKRTWWCKDEPIDAKEAHTRLCWAEFDRFCQKRDARQVKELEGIPTLKEEEPVQSD